MIKKKLKLDFYTIHSNIIEQMPIKIKSAPPTWWKELKSAIYTWHPRLGLTIPSPTAKCCPGIGEYITEAIQLKLPSDAIFKISTDGHVEMVTPDMFGYMGVAQRLKGDQHHRKQFGDLYPNRAVFKLNSPWICKSNRKANFMMTECHYTEDLRKHGILVAPGIVNFYDQYSMNMFLIFPIKDEEYTVKLKHGTPIASLYAMHEEKMDIKMHRVNEETLKSIVSARIPSVFFRKYYSGKNTRRK